MRFPIGCFPAIMRLTKGNLPRLVLPAGKSEMIVFDEALPGFGIRVRSGGKRTWIAQYRVGAKQRRVALGTVETVDPDEARKRAKEALGKVSLGRDPQAEKSDAREKASLTLGSVVPRYLTYAEPRQRLRHHTSTRVYLEQHWAPLSGKGVDLIDRASVAARLLEIASASGPFAANRARAALSAFYSWAIGEGLANANPVVGTHKPAEEAPRDRVLMDTELSLVWHRAGLGDFGNIVRLLILTAARREEIGGMLWSELQGDALRIGAARSKNRQAHEIPLSGPAMAIVAALPRRDERELVFGMGKGSFSGWSKAKAELDARMTEALRVEQGSKAKLAPWRLHDIRRTTATRMGDLGVLPHVVEAVLGHISGSKAGIAGTYNRAAYRDEKRAALALWGDRVAALTRAGNGAEG